MDSSEGIADWSTGEEWWAAGEDVAEGTFRWFAEECDLIQGVVIYAGMENAWGTFAAECAQRLRDELGTLPIWVWAVGGSAPVRPSQSRAPFVIFPS
jgi:Tubulin domain